MLQVPYNNSAATQTFYYPANWDAQSITGVTLTVNDVDNNELLAAAATTLYTADALGAAGSVGDSTVTFTTTAPTPGKQYEIAASAAGPVETITIQSYNASTKVATLKRDLRYAHTNATAIKGLYCTYDLDTSTVADFPEGEQLVLISTPAGSDDLPVYQRAEIGSRAFGVQNFDRRFKYRYPRTYTLCERRFDDLTNEAYEYLQFEMKTRGLNIDRVVDTDLLTEVMLPLMHKMAVVDGGDKWEHEQSVADKEYNAAFEKFCSLPVWQDSDQDDIRDDPEEIQPHAHIFTRGR
ncbi:MAG: hypothetical protein GY854_19870 [Deltaproteobacteria bacterium]|nr:hypothetical protein [Deltaproteobacteria bacterium]